MGNIFEKLKNLNPTISCKLLNNELFFNKE